MATILPHTTRATGTVLTATIYNTDHQNHITNANSLNTELGTVSGVGSATGIIVSNGAGVISGRTLEAGNNIVITNPTGVAGNPSIKLGGITTVDNTIARYDGTAGAIQPSGVVISDTNALSGISGILITSTDAGATSGPNLEGFRDSASPATDDALFKISFTGRDSGGNKLEYAYIEARIADPTNGSEDGRIAIGVMKGGLGPSDICQFNPGVVTLITTNAPTANIAQINTSSDANLFILSGGNTGATGGQIFIYGQSHSTNASDIAFFSANVQKLLYDASDGQWEIPAAVPIDHGTWSATGASAGTRITAGLIVSSGTGTGSTTHQAYYNGNGNVGGIATSGTTTTFATSSDERLKDFIGIYDPQKAIAIIRADPVRDFNWKKTGEYAVGWGGQTSYKVSKDLAIELDGVWGVDQGKRTPYLWAAMTWALDKIEEIEARLNAH